MSIIGTLNQIKNGEVVLPAIQRDFVWSETQICDPDKAYSMKRVKMRVLELIEDVSLGSQLGKLMSLDGVGVRSVQKLVQSGINDLTQLKSSPDSELIEMGLRNDQIATIRKWLSRKNR